MNGTFNVDDLKSIETYSSLLANHGDSFRALGWGSSDSQRRRFEVIGASGIQPGDSVLDVGCGLADLNAWFLDNLPGVTYSGIDITKNMASKAKERFPNSNIVHGHLFDLELEIKPMDYCVASGIFFLREEDPQEYMQATIRHMFNLCRKGVIFNSLSSWADTKDVGEFYACPTTALEFCRSLSSKVVLRHDYHPGDFTIYLYKAEPFAEIDAAVK